MFLLLLSSTITLSCGVECRCCLFPHSFLPPDHQEEAVEEFRKALKIRESLLTPEDRRIAEWYVSRTVIKLDSSGCLSLADCAFLPSHFQLGMALTFAKEFDKAVEVSALLPHSAVLCHAAIKASPFITLSAVI